jgi:hypothetical protein
MNKYIRIFIAALIFAAATVTCKKDDPELSVSAHSLSFLAAGGAMTFDVTTNVDWSVSGQPAWLTISPTSGKSGKTTVTATAQENTNTEARPPATLTVTVKGLPPGRIRIARYG